MTDKAISKPLTLYDLGQQYRELMVLATTDELPPEVVRDTLEAVQGDLQVKSIGICKFIAHLDASADAIEEAAKQMMARAAVVRRRAESLRQYTLFAMQASGITRIETAEVVLTVRENPPRVMIAEGAQLPEEFLVTPPAPPPHPDKRKLHDAIKSGREIVGVWLERGQRLEVK